MRLPILAFVISCTALSKAYPSISARDEASTFDLPAFINSDGTIDFASLVQASQINPPEEIPALPINQSTTINPASLVAQAVMLATDQTNTATQKSDDSEGGDGSLAKRSTYVYGPSGCGTKIPTTTTDSSVPQGLTVDAFTSSTKLKSVSTNAITPNGFVGAYSGQNGVYTSGSGVNSYLTMQILSTYAPSTCAKACQNMPLCQAFNIYFERDPSIDCQDPAIDPSYADNYHPDYAACADPPANTNIVCTYWTNPVSLAGATNTGQYRGSVFQVVEAGSNGYNMVTKPKEYPGYTVKTYVGNLDNTVAVFAGILSVSMNSALGANSDACYQLASKQYKYLAKSFSSFTLYKYMRGVDKNNPDNRIFAGVGCIIYASNGFSDSQFNDRGQYDALGNYYQVNPVSFYSL